MSTLRAAGFKRYEFEEAIDHITSGHGFPELEKSEYVYRHVKAASYIHWSICREYNIKVGDKCYVHTPETVTENETCTILWPVHTNKESNPTGQTS